MARLVVCDICGAAIGSTVYALKLSAIPAVRAATVAEQAKEAKRRLNMDICGLCAEALVGWAKKGGR